MSTSYKPRSGLPVNWPKVLVPFQNDFSNFFDVFGMPFNITSKKLVETVLKMLQCACVRACLIVSGS